MPCSTTDNVYQPQDFSAKADESADQTALVLVSLTTSKEHDVVSRYVKEQHKQKFNSMRLDIKSVEEGLITSNLDWNQRIASDLVTLCCTPTLASCCLLLATLYPARSSTT